MTQPDPITLDLDPSGYVAGLGRAERQTADFSRQLHTMAIAAGPAKSALEGLTPTRAMLGSAVGFTAVAAKQQQALSGLAASARVTGMNFGRMTGGMRQIAREYPVGNKGALELVTTMNRLGIVSTGTPKNLNNVSKAVQGFQKSIVGSTPVMEKFSDKIDSWFGTKGKLSSGGAEKRITDLGKAFTKLGGATGEAPAALATSMVQLNRSMNTGMSVDRVTKMSDVLTTMSQQSGVSANGILQFSKAIAPMAQAAGIGQTQVMGIATAFTKLGDDGLGASTAFNKMLGDMHRSVREGTPEMAAYAQIVGQTTEEFQALFEAKPGEAMTQVVEAIGRSGNAPRLLEQVGLEGVRNAKYLTNLAQAGDLRGESNKAVAAYGNGSTEQAAEAAYGGLVDSTVRVKDNLMQLAEAIGRPLLPAMTTFTNLIGSAISPLREAVDNKVVQGVGSVAAPAALLGLLGTKVIGPMLTATGIGQMLTSGPVRGALAGYASSGAPGSGFLHRFSGINRFGDNVAAGKPVGTARMQGFNMGAYDRAAGVGRFLQGSVAGTGPGLASRAFGSAGLGAAMYMRMMSENARLARTPFEKRESVLSKMNPQTREFMEERNRVKEQREINRGYGQGYGMDRAAGQAALSNAWKKLSVDSAHVGGTFRLLGKEALRLGAQLAMTGASAMKRGAMTALAPVGGPYGMAALAGVGILYGISRQKRQQEEIGDKTAAAATYMDDLRVAMGKATDAAGTFAGRLTEAAKAASDAPQSEAEARGMDKAEYDRARASGEKPARDYSGGIDRVKELLALQKNVAPDEINRIQQDLANSSYTVEQILEATSGLGMSGSRTTDTDRTGAIQGAVSGISEMPRDFGFLGWKKVLSGGGNGGMGSGAGDAASSGLIVNTLGKPARERAQDVATDIRETRKERTGLYSSEYADKKAFEEMDAAVSAAVKDGNINLVRQLVASFQGDSTMFSGAFKGGIDMDELKELGFTGVMAREDKGFREGRYKTVNEAEDKAGGELKPQISEDWAVAQINKDGKKNPVAEWFRGATAELPSAIQNALSAVSTAEGKPEAPKLQIAFQQQAMREAQAAGDNLGKLASDALNAANNLGKVADAAVLMAGYQGMVQQEQIKESDMGPAEAGRSRGNRYMREYAMNPNTGETAGMNRAAQTAAVQEAEQRKAQARSMLTNIRQQQEQKKRMEEDYARQSLWATNAYNLQIKRVEQDYGRQREIAFRDRAKGLLRAARDFAKQMRRAAEDGARAMYDAYSRIQVQPTWDAANMLGNLGEQNQAIQSQIENLAKLRQQGGSSNLIKLLGLNDPKNAQQLASLVGDAVSDPRVIGEMNKAAEKRQKLGGSLVNDKDNTDRNRQIEDYQTSLKDSTVDFNTAMSDMAVMHKTAMDRALEDRGIYLEQTSAQHATALDRMATDIRMSTEVIVGDQAALTKAMGEAVSGNVVTFTGLIENSLKGVNELVKDLDHPEWIAIMGDTGLTINVKGGYSPAQGSAGGGRQGTPPGNPSPTAVDRGNKIPAAPEFSGEKKLASGATVSYSDPRLKNYPEGSSITKTTDGREILIVPGSIPKAAPPLRKSAGGRVYGAGTGTSDSIPALLSKGEYVIKEQTARTIGYGNLDDLNEMKTKSGPSHSTYTGPMITNIDQSQRIEQVTVVSNDPDQMISRLKAMQSRSNLTKPGQAR